MATSGTSVFNPTVDDIIQEAYDRCGIESRTGYELKSGKRSLNLLLQSLQNEHFPLWKLILDTTTVTLVTDQIGYDVAADVLDVIDVSLQHSTNSIVHDTPLTRLSRAEYESRTTKTTSGRPTQYYYDYNGGTSGVGKFFLYPAPSSTYNGDELRFYKRERIEDVGAYTNTLDIPVNALETVHSGLSYMLSIKHAPDRIPVLKPLFDEAKLKLWQEDSEKVAVRP
jgi:hypothetical protein